MAQDSGLISKDPLFNKIFLSTSTLQKISSAHVWCEGPVWIPNKKCVVFSDVKANRMFKWNEKDGTQIYRKYSNYSNGNAIDHEGRLITCEHGRRCISRTNHDGSVDILIDSFEGKRFNSPNDVVVKSDGTIWFTDPPYGIQSNLEGYASPSQIIGCYVYRFDPEGIHGEPQLNVATIDVWRPNGLAFSPDEEVLYVVDMSVIEFPQSGKRHIKKYVVNSDGKTLSQGEFIFEVTPGIPDGITVDKNGFIFTSSENSIQVFKKNGTLLGQVMVPECVSNCTFGGEDNHTLFITATTSLYMIETSDFSGRPAT